MKQDFGKEFQTRGSIKETRRNAEVWKVVINDDLFPSEFFTGTNPLNVRRKSVFKISRRLFRDNRWIRWLRPQDQKSSKVCEGVWPCRRIKSRRIAKWEIMREITHRKKKKMIRVTIILESDSECSAAVLLNPYRFREIVDRNVLSKSVRDACALYIYISFL